MLYMVIEKFRPGRAKEIYQRFRERGRMAPANLKYISSWVDLEFRRCFQLMETDDESAFLAWTSHWDDLVDFEITPVQTSAQVASQFESDSLRPS